MGKSVTPGYSSGEARGERQWGGGARGFENLFLL